MELQDHSHDQSGQEEDDDPYKALLSWLTAAASLPEHNSSPTSPDKNLSTARPWPLLATKTLPAAATGHCIMPDINQDSPAMLSTYQMEPAGHSLGHPTALLLSTSLVALEAFPPSSSMAPFYTTTSNIARHHSDHQTSHDLHQQQWEGSQELLSQLRATDRNIEPSAHRHAPTTKLPDAPTTTSSNPDPSLESKQYPEQPTQYHALGGLNGEFFVPCHSSQPQLPFPAGPNVPLMRHIPGFPPFMQDSDTLSTLGHLPSELHHDTALTAHAHPWSNRLSATSMKNHDQIAESADKSAISSSAANQGSLRISNVMDIDKAHRNRRFRDTFPVKLFKMLSQAANDGTCDIVLWTEDGKAFKVHDKKRFIPTIASKYFRHKNMASFRRQLSAYKFERNPRDGSYHHALFQKGRPDLVDLMERDQGGTPVDRDE